MRDHDVPTDSQTMLTRRHFLRCVGATSTLTISAATLAACGGGAAPQPTVAAPAAKISATAAPTTAPAPTSAPVVAATAVAGTPTAAAPPKSVGKGTLVFQTPGVGAEGTAFAPSAIKFSQQTGIKVEYVDSGLNFEKYAVQYASGSGGDVYEYETKQILHYATLGAFLNLDPYVAKSTVMKPADFFPVIWNKCHINGHLYAAPEETTPVAVYYNKDLFQAAGVKPPPTSWADASWDWNAFLDTAQKLSKPDKTQFGVTISTWWVYSLPWIWSNGGHEVDEALTKATFNTPGVIGGWQYLRDLRWKYNVWAQPKQKDAGFNVGGDAMFLSGPYSIPGLRAGAKVPWAVGALPKGKAGVWTRDPANCYTIWAGSKNKDEAFQFLEFLSGPEGQLILGQSARGIPARKSVATSKAFLQQGDVNWQVFVDAIDQAGIAYPKPGWTWNDLWTMAGKLTLQQGDQRRFGLQYATDLHWLYPFYGSLGGTYFDQGLTKATFDTAASQTALQMLLDARVKSNVTPYGAQATAISKQANGKQPFTLGNYGMEHAWIGLIAYLHDKGVAVTNWDVAPIPTGGPAQVQMVGGQGFAIVSGAKHPEEAWIWNTFMVSDEVQKMLGVNGVWFPGRKSMAKFGIPSDGQPSRFIEAFYDPVGTAGMSPWWYVPGWDQWSKVITDALAPAWNGQALASDVAAKITPTLDSMLQARPKA